MGLVGFEIRELLYRISRSRYPVDQIFGVKDRQLQACETRGIFVGFCTTELRLV